MPVYLITLHAYRSWRTDNPRGFVQRDKGVQPTNPQLQKSYDAIATHPLIVFDASMQQLLVWGSLDLCQRRSWCLHAVAAEPSHIHTLISWRDGSVTWQSVRRVVKNILSWMLGCVQHRKGGHWFVEDGSRKRVKDHAHFDYLVNTYLPQHRGVYWHEGQVAPVKPVGLVLSNEPPVPPVPPQPPASAGGY